MDLEDLEKEIDAVILSRGRDYLQRGLVSVLTNLGGGDFVAEVQGRERYKVLVKLDPLSDAVLSLDCSCPYDAPICKHGVAVLLLMRDEGTDKPKTLLPPQMPLKHRLARRSKEDLVELLVSLASESDVIARRIEMSVFEGGDEARVRESRLLIRSYIDDHADRHGFVEYRDVYRAVDGARLVMEQARGATDGSLALTLSFCVLEEMLDLLQTADDSSGTIGGVIEESLEYVGEVLSRIDADSELEAERFFDMLLAESADGRLHGWPDWQLRLLGWALDLATTAERKTLWDQQVAAITPYHKAETWGRDYFGEKTAMMQYHWLIQYEGEIQARNFLKDHLRYPSFRELAIQEALQAGRYDEGLELARDGEVLDRGLRGLVHKWKELAYQAARASGQLELQRTISRELVETGDYDYYAPLKATYSSNEWRSVYPEILQSLAASRPYDRVYTRILVEERELERLLAYVSERPERIEEFYRVLMPEFRPAVIRLFQAHIQATAVHSTTRKAYQNVCRIIRMPQQAGAELEASQITGMLLNTYTNKPAFREELGRIMR